MEDRLRYIFDLVNHWLKFADAKNGALFVAASGFALATVKLVLRLQSHTAQLVICGIGFGLVVVAALVCLYSFLPHLAFRWLVRRGDTTAADNLIFFGDIAKYGDREYLDAIRKASNETGTSPEIERHLAAQIVTNARIALQKFHLARTAAIVLFLGAAIVIGVGCLDVFTNPPQPDATERIIEALRNLPP